MLNVRFLLLVVLCFVIGLNCSGEVTYTVEEVDGVSIVHNLKPKSDDENAISLEFVRQIGEFDAVDKNYEFFKPNDIAIDKTGNMYILDAGNFRVQKFNSDGEFMLSFLRQGEGPGELQNPNRIIIDSEGNIHAFGRGRGPVQVFSSDGDLVASHRSGGMATIFELLDNGAILIEGVLTPENFENNNKPLLQINDQNGDIIAKFGTIRQYENMGMRQVGNSLKVDVDKNGFIYASFNFQNRIEKYSPDGEMIFKSDRVLNYEESETFDIIQVNVQGVFESKFDVNTFSYGLQIDHKSRIWILSHKRQLTTEELGLPETPPDLLNFEIYDTDGILLNRIPWEKGMLTSYRIFGDRILFMDSTKEMAVFEYKIVD